MKRSRCCTSGSPPSPASASPLSGPAVNGWTLAWTFPGNQQIADIWNATRTQTGQAVSARDAGHNAFIGPNGGSVNFGFNGSYSGTNAEPVSFTLNGVLCDS